MTIETQSMHITPVGGNVFADLGFAPEEAATLKAESQRIISEKLSIKYSLMTDLAEWIAEKNLKQADAAEILGVTRPRVSDVIHKKAIKFTIDALVDMLARTGKHVQLTVRCREQPAHQIREPL
ncbi:XRE family transcriptional regulator [Acidithiobacillus marinus]|uniref:XRE family transcriptional regulator n=1 Tax=Acidithiobacillus marinus TaxID=187490 RepID=A0A2I1DJA0_9PROT|nr:XRE family transcriptional regulator [Acidithiobacillus marinus]PKY09942.1 XRE family transcriptional regulator [Acidithiobacillus marinus]